MRARFLVMDTFDFSTKKELAFVGTVLEGKPEIGMTVRSQIRGDDAVARRIINVEMLCSSVENFKVGIRIAYTSDVDRIWLTSAFGAGTVMELN